MSTDESCLDENSRDQIEILLGSLVQTIAQDCEQHFEKLHRQETSEASKDLFEKLTLLLGIMINLTRSVLLVKISADEHNIKENIWSAVKKPCINCLRKTLVDSNVQVCFALLCIFNRHKIFSTKVDRYYLYFNIPRFRWLDCMH